MRISLSLPQFHANGSVLPKITKGKQESVSLAKWIIIRLCQRRFIVNVLLCGPQPQGQPVIWYRCPSMACFWHTFILTFLKKTIVFTMVRSSLKILSHIKLVHGAKKVWGRCIVSGSCVLSFCMLEVSTLLWSACRACWNLTYGLACSYSGVLFWNLQ